MSSTGSRPLGEAIVKDFAQLTYAGVLLAVFANQLCLPVPSVIFLMAAGALSARGEMHTSLIIGLGITGCLAADWIWFWFGRRWGSQAVRLLCRLSADPREGARRAREKFHRYGLFVLCVAKFIPGLDGLLPPLAGAEGVSLTCFLALDLLGGFLWAAFYVGLGYLLANQLDVAMVWVKQFGAVDGTAIAAPVFFNAGWRGLALAQMIRRLRLRRISPQMLQRKLKSSGKVAVLDLLEFEEESDTESPGAIPGSFRVDPERLRKSPRIAVPGNVDIVLYSSSGGFAVSARAAMALKRIGVNNVWVLEGGLKAWCERGLPVAESPDTPEMVAQRVGVTLPAG
jgi:membrane protein DedA with SNARE-associated domain/rhodanese-related sulfurtransferase